MLDKEWFTRDEAAEVLQIPTTQLPQVVADRNIAVMWRKDRSKRRQLLVKASDLHHAAAELASDRRLYNR
jgi:hypothetical protein